MFRSDQKLFGYVKEGNEWIEFDSWFLMKLTNESDTKYREWHSKYFNRIHVNKDIESDKIFFHRGHATYSFFSKKDRIPNKESKTVTLSHILRQKVISERTEAIFSIRNIINKKINSKKQVNIKYKKVLIEETIKFGEEAIRPDITIVFDEPIELALKWKNKLYVEVVENNEVNGHKIGLLKQLGHGVIEIPYSEAFDIFKNRKFKSISKQEITNLEFKIRNFFKKAIWADLIVNPSSDEYKKIRIESKYHLKYKELHRKFEESKEKIKELSLEKIKINEEYEELVKENKNLNISNQLILKKVDELINKCLSYEEKIREWNKKGTVSKLFNGLKNKK